MLQNSVTAGSPPTVTLLAPSALPKPIPVIVTTVPAGPPTGQIGVSVTVAVPVVEFAWLVAVTVTVCRVVMLAGAVYNPLALIESVPEEEIVQFTDWLLVPLTVALNGCV